MNRSTRVAFCLLALGLCLLSLGPCLSAQNYKADRLRKAVEVLGVRIAADSLLPENTFYYTASDGRRICLRTDPMGVVEHVGIPLFSEVTRSLQPWPVYDFLEYAVLNWKYQVNPNQLYLSKVLFDRGSWNTLLEEDLLSCDCTIDNRDDKFFVVTWSREGKEVAVIGIPIEYELLNNDTRRNMERDFIKELVAYRPAIVRPVSRMVSESELSIYGTEGLFVVQGQSYLIDLLNQNVYYKLNTVYETADTIVGNNPAPMTMEAVVPVVVVDTEFMAETFANLMMCDDASVPDVKINLDFHLSNYHREKVIMPLSQLRAFCRQQGCQLYFACDGKIGDTMRGMMLASNLTKGYNHLLSLRIPSEQLTSSAPTVQADVYLFIPPIDKAKLFGTVPEKKSGGKLKLP